MKMIAIIGDEETRPLIRKMFTAHQVTLFSSIAIRGCSCESGGEPVAWWPAGKDIPTVYSSLCFAILDDEKAEKIMKDFEEAPLAADPAFPSKAFMMNVEKMI
ncbi:hypothetical protein NY406_09455 [Chlorobaculum sp. MV4-Y]|jgi:hypothetical protein|uniref:hypothetical protein n=1 Tax=Chlorobaculum sp. MV4-Y TaxID=2976335 RepID=UPI0021AE4789|nr:hypothetical protein [Chlorobaculum sp. MV4-Y]UWX57422.1 hypothetical protein NY406_09455 [Chlorobaculum sp. MV4-Y]